MQKDLPSIIEMVEVKADESNVDSKPPMKQVKSEPKTLTLSESFADQDPLLAYEYSAYLSQSNVILNKMDSVLLKLLTATSEGAELFERLRKAKEAYSKSEDSILYQDLEEAQNARNAFSEQFLDVFDFDKTVDSETIALMKQFADSIRSLADFVDKKMTIIAEKNDEVVSVIQEFNELAEELDNTEFETDEDEEDQFEGMLSLTGVQFKSLLSKVDVSEITGFVLNVTDREMVVQPCQPLTLNERGKIRPPVSAIKDETIIYIDQIKCVNENTGRIYDVEDLPMML